MADEATKQDNPQQTDENGQEGSDESQRIPYQRFEEVNKRARQAEKELADLRSKILEFEDRDKSEVDRERSARQRAESQLAELTGKVTSLEKGSWVRSVAAELNFHDPEDAVQHLRDDLGRLEDHSRRAPAREEPREDQEAPGPRGEEGRRPPVDRADVRRPGRPAAGQRRAAAARSARQLAAAQEMQLAQGSRISSASSATSGRDGRDFLMPRRRTFPKTFQAYLATSAARTASGNGTAVSTGLEAAQVAKLDVTAVSGTTPSLTVVIEESANGSTGWATKASFTARTTAGSQIIALPRLNHGFLRATWTISGTTPSFTFSVQVSNSDSSLL
jgi:hypothetical protein